MAKQTASSRKIFFINCNWEGKLGIKTKEANSKRRRARNRRFRFLWLKE
jgi:hypothetical protein